MHDPAVLLPGIEPRYSLGRKGGGLRVRLDAAENRKISCPFLESNPISGC